MIKNIVFDMGQVLLQWRPQEMIASYNLTCEEETLVLRELFQNVEWVQLDRGVVTEAEVVQRVCARLPEQLHGPVETLTFGWHKRHLIPMPGMAELVRELKEEGYGIYLLSNANLALRSYFPRIPGSECFDGLLVSAEEKLLKPQPEIYYHLYERFNLNPAECFFIDDNPANVEGAILTGMNGFVFRGEMAPLRRALRAVGVNCKENAQ